MHSPARNLLIGLVVLLGLWALWNARWSRSTTQVVSVPSSKPFPAEEAKVVAESGVTPPVDTDAMRKWSRRFSEASTSPARQALLNEGIRIAGERAVWMAQLIRDNPKRALDLALRLDEYEALPPEVRNRVEKPFCERVSYEVYPVCPGVPVQAGLKLPSQVASIRFTDGTVADAFTYGSRAGMMTKRNLPVSGILLNDVAAIRDRVFQPLDDSEVAAAERQFPAGQREMHRSLSTGREIAGTPLIAIAGGKRFAFEDRPDLEVFESKLAAFDALPGPGASSDVLFSPALADSLAGTPFNLTAAAAEVAVQASAWTETKKRLFLIRVDFSDYPGEPVSQAAANTAMASGSAQIREMSYGKTWVEAASSANLYRMPNAASVYVGGTLNSQLLRDARNTFRNSKSGADAAINIGPVSNTGNGDTGGLGDYDIVGVSFTYVGMSSGGVYYAGLAGGSSLWMQGSNDVGVYVHEWGHNYGIGHASFWQTSDGSVVGNGTSNEYGDIFDVMGGGPVPEGHYHPQGKALLNWITTSQWADASVQGSGTYRVRRIDSSIVSGTTLGVRVTKSGTSGAEYYWIGYRSAFSSYPALNNGAYLIWQRPGQSRSWLLDTTPGSSAGRNDGPLALGRTFSDTTSGVHITPLGVGGSAGDEWLDVAVNIGAFPANLPPGTVSISGSAVVPARVATAYSAAATDPNGDALSYGWQTADGAPHPDSAALSQVFLVGGTYSLSVTVSDRKGGTSSATKLITVTDPLDTWQAGSVGANVSLDAMVSGKGRLVAAEYWGTAYFSWDGVTWNSVGALPSIEREPKLAYGGGIFVAGGKLSGSTAAQLCYSIDGRAWQSASFPAGVPQIRSIAYGAGSFTAVADDGAVLRSTNGVQWTLATVATAPDFRFVVYDGAVSMAVSLNDAGTRPEKVWTSVDGTTWNVGPLLGYDVDDIAVLSGTIYATGWYGGINYSTNHGSTWKSAATPGTSRWSGYHFAVGPNGTLVMCGQAMDESGQPGAFLVSVDGLTWGRSNAFPSVYPDALRFEHGRLYTVESSGTVRWTNSLFTSNATPSPAFTAAPSSATAREPVYFAGSGSDADGDALTYAWDLGAEYPIQDGAEMAPSFPFGGTYPVVLHVSDGRGGIATLTQNVTVNDPARTWTQRTSATTNDFNAIAASGTRVVAVGRGASVRYSNDGITWSNASVPNSTNVYLNGIVWDGSLFVAAGNDYDFGIPGWVGIIFTSPDGVTWTQRYKNTVASTELYGIAVSGSTRVAVGKAGKIFRSTNGTSWSSVTAAAAGSSLLSGIGANGSTFVATGYTGGNGTCKVISSVDGQNWFDNSAGAGVASWQDLRKVAWLNDRFVSSGWYSKLRTSLDAGQSFNAVRTKTEELPAMAYGDGLWLAAGVDRDASSADVDVMSIDGTKWYSLPAPTTSDRNGAAFFRHTFITVGAGGTIYQSGTVTPTGWSTWNGANFPAGGLSSLGDRDPDADGIPNLVEYALGRNPNLATGTNGTTGITSKVRGTRSAIRLDMPASPASDITYTIEGKTDLSQVWTAIARKVGAGAWTWLAGGASQIYEDAPSGGRVPTDIGVPDSQLASPRYFFRLTVGR